MTEQSDSDLSDVVEDPASPLPSPDAQTLETGQANENQIFDDESTPDEDALGSDDPDYDAETPPPQQPESYGTDHSSSDTSSKQKKRKLPMDENEHMQNDPELYGLRRSVRITSGMLTALY